MCRFATLQTDTLLKTLLECYKITLRGFHLFVF